MAQTTRDLEALADKLRRMQPSDLFLLAQHLLYEGKDDLAESVANVAVEKLAAKRLGIRL